jgi:hypothetical protein
MSNSKERAKLSVRVSLHTYVPSYIYLVFHNHPYATEASC